VEPQILASGESVASYRLIMRMMSIRMPLGSLQILGRSKGAIRLRFRPGPSESSSYICWRCPDVVLNQVMLLSLIYPIWMFQVDIERDEQILVLQNPLLEVTTYLIVFAFSLPFQRP
jgi:hypothetical protein